MLYEKREKKHTHERTHNCQIIMCVRVCVCVLLVFGLVYLWKMESKPEVLKHTAHPVSKIYMWTFSIFFFLFFLLLLLLIYLAKALSFSSSNMHENETFFFFFFFFYSLFYPNRLQQHTVIWLFKRCLHESYIFTVSS